MPTVSIRGQRVSRMRIGGRWVQVDSAGSPLQSEETSADTTDDYSKMSRKELDEVAEAKGMNPSDYRNRDQLTAALQEEATK